VLSVSLWFKFRHLRHLRFFAANPNPPTDMNIPTDLKFAESHEWVRVEGNIATVGISDHAQHELTDIVFVELPVVGKKLEAGKECAVVESVKAASDIYAPVSGEVTEINQPVADDPGLANRDPYGKGWFFKLKLGNLAELDRLLTPDAYAKSIAV
jgi:glycine cleavage system H protein